MHIGTVAFSLHGQNGHVVVPLGRSHEILMVGTCAQHEIRSRSLTIGCEEIDESLHSEFASFVVLGFVDSVRMLNESVIRLQLDTALLDTGVKTARRQTSCRPKPCTGEALIRQLCKP